MKNTSKDLKYGTIEQNKIELKNNNLITAFYK